MSIRPVRDLVMVSPIVRENKTASGIILDDKSNTKQQHGVVVAVGPECEYVSVGDTILPEWNKGTMVNDQGTEYVLIPETSVIAILGD